MKKNLSTLAILLLILAANAQTDSLYLGQTPPGTTPELFADTLMTGGTALQCARIAISSDGKEIYYTRRTSYNVNEEDIRYFKYENNKWEGPFIIFPDLSSVHLAPTFSPDWDTLYFQVYDIDRNTTISYFSVKTIDGWAIPQLFKGYSGELYYLQETNNYNFYVGVQNGKNGIGKYDICKIILNNDTISELQSLGVSPNTVNNDCEFFIAKDESYIVLGRNENFSTRNRDLYISYKKSDNTWTNPKSLGPKINTGDALKWGPFVTSDNKYLFYESTQIRWTTWWVRFDNLLDSLKYTNFPPYVKSNIPDQKGTIGHLFSYTLPDSTFFDDDGNNTLTYSASLSNGDPLPENLISFNPTTRTFSETPDTSGTFKIKVTATDTADAIATTQFNITIIDPSTSINQIDNQKIFVYPNPSNGLFTISFGRTIDQEAKAEIYNAEGKLIYNRTFHRIANASIDLQGYPRGMYYLQVTHFGNIFRSALCVQ